MLALLTLIIALFFWTVLIASIFHCLGYQRGMEEERRWGYRSLEKEEEILVDRDEADWWKGGTKDATNQKR